jgi:hypothetical protein
MAIAISLGNYLVTGTEQLTTSHSTTTSPLHTSNNELYNVIPRTSLSKVSNAHKSFHCIHRDLSIVLPSANTIPPEQGTEAKTSDAKYITTTVRNPNNPDDHGQCNLHIKYCCRKMEPDHPDHHGSALDRNAHHVHETANVAVGWNLGFYDLHTKYRVT